MNKSFVLRTSLNMLVSASAFSALVISQAALAQNQKERAQAEVSAGPEGEVVWDMVFRAIDTNDNGVAEWSELERHYNDRLASAGWDRSQVVDRFDRGGDNALDKNEYQRFLSALEKNAVDKRNQAQKVAATKNKKPSDFAVKDGKPTVTDGFSAETVMGMDVVGKKGEKIGSVENLLINQNGKIVAVIAQVGGVWDIGDTHVAVPWAEVTVKNSNLHAPITEKNASEYSLFKQEYFTKQEVGEIRTVQDDLNTGPKIWKATDLMDDYVLLESGEGYGYIDNLTFNKNGELQSVVVNASNPDYDYGYYAYPWYGYGYGYNYGWNSALGQYVLPYGNRDLVGL